MSIEKLKYISYGQTMDGTNYCSGVETLAENMLEDNEDDAVLVYPSADGWAKVTSSEFRITDQNSSFKLPFPIYKIKRFLLRPRNKLYDVTFGHGSDASLITIPLRTSDFKNKNNESIDFIDATNFILPEKVKESLPVSYSADTINKHNVLFYKEGEAEINIRGEVTDPPGILNKGPVYDLFATALNNAVLQKENDDGRYSYTYVNKDTGYSETAYLFAQDALAAYPYDGENVEYIADPRYWQFRIEYVPLTSKTKMRARKSEKTNVDYIQPHNQRAEINAVSAFGKNMWLTAQKTGTKTITVVKRYKYLSDIPQAGSTVWHDGRKYVIVANSYKMTNTMFLQVTHTLSENWTSKSKHVSVDQKYRNYKIPQDILWRNLYWEDFIIAGATAKDVYKGDSATNDKFIELSDCLQLLNVDSQYDRCINSFSWLFDVKDKDDETTIIDTSKQGIGVTLPCITYGVANSIVFSAEFKDQLSAGLRRYLKGETIDTVNGKAENESGDLCEEALYCAQNGKLTSATVVLSDGFSSRQIDGNTYNQDQVDDYARTLYPIIKGSAPFKEFGLPMVLNYPTGFPIADGDANYALFSKKFYIDKQPGEAIKFTYQIHCVGEDGCVFGNKFAEHNTLIKKHGKDRTLRVWLLDKYIREGAEKLENPSGDCFETTPTAAQDAYFTNEPKSEGVILINLTQRILDIIKDSDGLVKAWAITDEENNLYVGRNNDTTGEIYFTMTHKRI